MIYTVSLNPAIDRTLRIDRLILHEINTAEAVGYVPAGKGINVCRTLSCLETESTVLGLIGCDEEHWFRNSLKKQNIHCCFVPVDGITRISTTIICSSGEKETHIKELGFTVTEENISDLIRLIENTITEDDIACLTGSAPPGVTLELFRQVCSTIRERAGFSVYDIGGSLLQAVSSCPPDLIKPNREELVDLTGESDVNAMLEKAHNAGFRQILLTLGRDGAVFSDGSGRYTCKSPSISAASTVGAGDASLAGFLAAKEAGKEIAECLKWAVASGTANAEEPFAGEISLEKFKKILKNLKTD